MGTDRRDRRHVVEVEHVLALNVHPDPGHERKPVAETRVDGVLEVRVRVHEAGDDHAARRGARPGRGRRRSRPPRSCRRRRSRRPRSRSAGPRRGRPSPPRRPSRRLVLRRSGSSDLGLVDVEIEASVRRVGSSPDSSSLESSRAVVLVGRSRFQRFSISPRARSRPRRGSAAGSTSNSERDGIDGREQDREGDHQRRTRSGGCGAACRS